jgi:RHS repeat-associated protein
MMWYTLDCLAAARTGFIHADHLGSTSLTTDITGTLVAETRYLPYGEERWITGTLVTDFTFTGQRAERGFALMDYNARYYDPGLGRFVNADTVVPDPGNPQALNRYVYAINNPLRYNDPSGHYACEDAYGDCKPPRIVEREEYNKHIQSLANYFGMEEEVFRQYNPDVLEAIRTEIWRQGYEPKHLSLPSPDELPPGTPFSIYTGVDPSLKDHPQLALDWVGLISDAAALASLPTPVIELAIPFEAISIATDVLSIIYQLSKSPEDLPMTIGQVGTELYFEEAARASARRTGKISNQVGGLIPGIGILFDVYNIRQGNTEGWVIYIEPLDVNNTNQ